MASAFYRIVADIADIILTSPDISNAAKVITAQVINHPQDELNSSMNKKPDKVLHHVAIIVNAQTHHLQLTLDHLHKALASTCCNIAAILLQYWCSAFCKACLQHTEKRLWAGFPAP